MNTLRNPGGFGCAAIVLLLLVPTSIHAVFCWSTKSVVVATVTGKDRIVESSGEKVSSRYLVFTDKETLQNADCLWYAKWNSSDIQGQLRDGQKCTFTVYGWRIPFCSAYRNIVSVQ